MCAASTADAKSFRWANNLDAATLDPYARNVVFDLLMQENSYEPLARRRPDLSLEPALATEWKLVDPTTWRFTLRQGVKFHDGTPFTADDVVFSYKRATGPGSVIGAWFSTVKDVVKVDDHTIDIQTRIPNPILPGDLAWWFIMSRGWAERNNVTRVVDPGRNEENFAVLHENGTGPFVVTSRRPDVETVWEPYAGWWDKPQHNITKATFNLLKDSNQRVSSLLAGSVDMIYQVPTQNVATIQRRSDLKILQAPETRTIFFGLDQASTELPGSNIKGKNPLRDLKVRQALMLAVDTDLIRDKIMRGFALPNALMVGPGITGWDAALNVRPKPDAAKAKALLAEAGYPSGFEIAMDCPNDRYVNDEAICQAVANMLAPIGIKVKVSSMPFTLYGTKIQPPAYGAASMAFVGWSPTAYDGLSPLVSIMMSRNPELRRGVLNFHNNTFPEIDRLGAAIAVEADTAKRTALLKEAFVHIRDNVLILPLHQQVVIWAAKANVSLEQRADNFFLMRHVMVK
jgi:peptide/nickel transport system substrate-binding protein